MLDAETWKTVISLLSAAVAVTSAVLAHRAKVQTRADLFSSVKNALQLTMGENDTQRRQLELRCGIMRSHLDRIPLELSNEAVRSAVEEFSSTLDGLEEIARALELRAYTEESIEEMPYSEKALGNLRSCTRREQVIATQIKPAAYDLIFGEMERFVDKYGLRV